MKPVVRHALLGAIAFAGLIATAVAQSGGTYELRWNTQDGGAAAMSGANGYAVVGTIGQADAGALQGGNGGYVLRGGFWPGAQAAGDIIFRGDFENTP